MEKSRPAISLFDAVNVALGSIIGAGIFVIIGAAAALAGPAVILSVAVAGFVSLLTGLCSSELSRLFPKSGGAYTFARESLSDLAGFLVGWIWIFSNIVIGATVAVGFAYYVSFFVPAIPTNIGAAFIVAAATLVQLRGIKESSAVSNVLVVLKILILLFFVATAVFFFKPSNFTPFMPFGIEGVLAGAATIFFAYSGFARVAVIAGEVKEPVKNVPRATMLSIIISTALYLLVAVAAIGMVGYAVLGKSGSPLATAMSTEGLSFGTQLVAAGALLATGTVVLASILGISRLAQAMAVNRELPAFLGKVDKRTAAPANAIILGGIAMLLVAFFADLPHIAYISSFSLLVYYAAMNLGGLRIFNGTMRVVAGIALLSCVGLMLSLPVLSWAVGIAAILLGLVYYFLVVKRN